MFLINMSIGCGKSESDDVYREQRKIMEKLITDGKSETIKIQRKQREILKHQEKYADEKSEDDMFNLTIKLFETYIIRVKNIQNAYKMLKKQMDG